MREAVIVSTARTAMAKAYRGEFNMVAGASHASFAVSAAVDRAGVAPDLIDDLVLGCGYPEGRTGRNFARQTVIRSGLPTTVAGATVNRFCASGLQAVAMAAKSIVAEGVAGGMGAAALHEVY